MSNPSRSAPPQSTGESGYDPSTLHIPAAALAAMSEFNKQVGAAAAHACAGMMDHLQSATPHASVCHWRTARMRRQLSWTWERGTSGSAEPHCACNAPCLPSPVLGDQVPCHGPGPFRAPRQVWRRPAQAVRLNSMQLAAQAECLHLGAYWGRCGMHVLQLGPLPGLQSTLPAPCLGSDMQVAALTCLPLPRRPSSSLQPRM